MVIAGANVHDAKLLAATLDAVIVERPEPSDDARQRLCLDQGYNNPTGRQAATERHYILHFTRNAQPGPAEAPRHPARRWVVERTLAWLSKCRAILVRWDKKASNYLALLKLACALLWYRRRHRLTVLR